MIVILLLALLPLHLASLHTPCGAYPMAMWGTLPFNDTLQYSLNSTPIILYNDFGLLPLSSIPNSSSPLPLLALDLSLISSSTVWDLGRLRDVVEYYGQGGEYVGVVVRDFGISPGVYNQFPWQQLNDFPYPVGLLGYNDFPLIFTKDCQHNITFSSTQNFNNHWKEVVTSGGYAIMHSVAVLLFFINLLLSILRLKDIMFKITIGSICLYSEVFANSLYLFRFSTNIAYAYLNYYNRALISTSELLSTTPVPFFLTASLLFVFFWLDITSTSNYLYDGKLLGVMKIPFTITIVLIFLLEIISDVFRFTLNSVSSSIMDVAGGLFYGIVLIFVIFLNSYALFKVMHQSQQTLRLNIIYPKVIFNIIILVIICILVLVGSSAVRNIAGYYVRRVLIFLCSSLQSMNQIIVFRTRSGSSQSHSHSKSQQKTVVTATL